MNIISNTKQEGFKNFFMNGISLPKLVAGEYTAHLQKASFIEGKTSDLDYVRLELQLEDRMIVDNKFEKGFGIFESQIKEQLGISDQRIAIPDLIEKLLQNPFKVWVSYDVVDGKTYRNVNYLPPLPVKEVAVTSTSEF